MERTGRVQIVDSPEAAEQMAATISRNGLVVVDFSAHWCGPCNAIFPVLVELSERAEFRDISFFKVDVDTNKALADAVGVSALPTFIFYRDAAKIDTLTGGNPVKLEQTLRKHVASVSGVAPDDPLTFPSGHGDLDSFVDKTQATCLNQSTEHTLQNVFVKGTGYLESDCDEQLLLYVPFRQPIKLHSICFVAPDDGRGPKNVKIFVNNPHMDFGSTDGAATQELQLKPDDLNENTMAALRFVKFQNVLSVTIFVESNQGDKETSVITQLRFIGQPLEASDMKNFKRIAGDKNESH
jgi:thioredoxin